MRELIVVGLLIGVAIGASFGVTFVGDALAKADNDRHTSDIVTFVDEGGAVYYRNKFQENDVGSAAMWEPLYVPSKGHKLYRCMESNRFAIADESGKYPDDTDDGILYVSETEPITLNLSVRSVTVIASIPVWSLRESRLCHTYSTMNLLNALRQHKPEQEVRIGDQLAAIIKDVWPYLATRLAAAL